MPIADVQLVVQWWMAFFVIGVAAFPLSKQIFQHWYDRGYLFSKALGLATVTYFVYALGTLRVLPFSLSTILLGTGLLFVFGLALSIGRLHLLRIKKPVHGHAIPIFVRARLNIVDMWKNGWRNIVVVGIEELFFFCALLCWAWVKAHEPSIQGLEKFMDYGFMQTLLNSQFFPAPDMWWAGGYINYYFFGHLVTAMMTMLSGLDLSVTFNLMLATIFAFTLTMSFSIGYQLSTIRFHLEDHLKSERWNPKALFAGVLTAFLVTLAGNMQTLYAFTKGYTGDAVVPFWTVLWSPAEFFEKLTTGFSTYWYANATRFIPFTIHEFPSYSFVVSDVHGHVLSIPFVLLIIAVLIVLGDYVFHKEGSRRYELGDMSVKQKSVFSSLLPLTSYLILLGFLLGVLLMTNALGGPIYGLIFVFLVGSTLIPTLFSWIAGIMWKNPKSGTPHKRFFSDFFQKVIIPVDIVGITAFVTALPFLKDFKSFATGIGVNCPPAFLANSKIGPFLFEGVEKCQKSPLWMMTLLWGFFWYTGIWLFFRNMWTKEEYDSPINRILKVFYICGMVFILIPEFFYVKDIYPAHFRSNTMFKLGYEAFILWSIIAGYVIVHFAFLRSRSLLTSIRYSSNEERSSHPTSYHTRTIRLIQLCFFLFLLPQLFLVSIYPYFSVRSYFGELKTYRGIYGLEWLQKEYKSDFAVIGWLKEQVIRQSDSRELKAESSLPVIVEADGDSYTNYNHISAFAGVPTVIGWAVHEWLWRGSYDDVSPRREDVRRIYESTNRQEIRALLDIYQVRYVIVGPLERAKFLAMQEAILATLGTVAFRSGDTTVYDVGVKTEVGY